MRCCCSVRSVRAWLPTLAVAGLLGCGGASTNGPVNPPPPPPPPAAPTVTSSGPVIGRGGDAAVQITISGTNFASGAQVAWELAGAPESKIQVGAVQVTSPTRLVAAITIAADAPVTLYDITVTNPDSKKGVGSALFEVTRAVPIAGAVGGRGVNELGTVVGWFDRGEVPGFVWTATSGATVLPTDQGPSSTNGAWAVDEAGTTVVGTSASNAVTWTSQGGAWTRANLPTDPAASHSLALAVGSDPLTGRARVIAGTEGIGTNPDPSLVRQPRAWIAEGTGWRRTVLPTPAGSPLGLATAASASGMVAGYVGIASAPSAAVWTPDGAGGWTLVVFGGPSSKINGLNSAGDLAVGQLGSGPALWRRTGSTWSEATLLPGTCNEATSVDDRGRILGPQCRPDGFRWMSVVWLPPYTSTSVVGLSGLGDRQQAGLGFAISRLGTWTTGQAVEGGKGTRVATYWRLF